MTTSTTGLAFARYTKALLIGGDAPNAKGYASGQAHRWRDTPLVKGAIDALGADDAVVHAAATPIVNDFLRLVRPHSVLDRVAGLRKVPQNVSMLKVAGSASAQFVGFGEPIPASKFSLDRETLEPSQLAALVVTTQELLRASGTLADLVFAEELARAIGQAGDVAFLDPASGPIADERPGSITHGITPISASGSTIAAVQADVKAWFAAFGGSLQDAVIVMAPRTALALGLLTGTSGAPLFPQLGPRGGSIVGVPVLTTDACLATGSPGETFAVLFDPRQVLLADDERMSVEQAKHASIQMNDAPGSGAQQLVSLWQHGLTAAKVVRAISWRRTNTAAVSVLANIPY